MNEIEGPMGLKIALRWEGSSKIDNKTYVFAATFSFCRALYFLAHGEESCFFRG